MNLTCLKAVNLSQEKVLEEVLVVLREGGRVRVVVTEIKYQY